MTRKQFDKRMKECREDAQGDGMEMIDVAYDLADNMLYDPEILKFAEKEFNTKNRTKLKEILADCLA